MSQLSKRRKKKSSQYQNEHTSRNNLEPVLPRAKTVERLLIRNQFWLTLKDDNNLQ